MEVTLTGKPFRLLDEYNMKFICRDDIPDIVSMLADPDVAKYLYYAPAPAEVYESYFGPIISDTSTALDEKRWPSSPTYVIRDDKNNFCGMCGLSNVMFLSGNFEVGYQLPKQVWGKGIATAACKVLTNLAFKTLNAHKVEASCYSQNIGSSRVLEKAGYNKEGTQMGYYKVDNDINDRLLFGMTKDQFNTIYTQ